MSGIPVPDNPAGLISTAAVQSGKRSYLFYSRPNGELAFLKSQTYREAEGNVSKVAPYKPSNIIMDGNVVLANKSSPQIAAVSYTLNGSDEIRVYYVSQSGALQELCRSSKNGVDSDWREGSLNNSQQPASPKTLLTASVDYTEQGQNMQNPELKLYYNRENNSFMWCTWVTLGQEAWATKVINEKY